MNKYICHSNGEIEPVSCSGICPECGYFKECIEEATREEESERTISDGLDDIMDKLMDMKFVLSDTLSQMIGGEVEREYACQVTNTKEMIDVMDEYAASCLELSRKVNHILFGGRYHYSKGAELREKSISLNGNKLNDEKEECSHEERI